MAGPNAIIGQKMFFDMFDESGFGFVDVEFEVVGKGFPI